MDIGNLISTLKDIPKEDQYKVQLMIGDRIIMAEEKQGSCMAPLLTIC